MFDFFYNFQGYNQEAFLLINQLANHSSIIAHILQIFSYCFNITNFAIIYLVLCLYFYIKFREREDGRLRSSKFWLIYKNMAMIGITYTIFCITYTTLKFTINLPRPFCSLHPDTFITIANTQYERCLSSFPSSHTGLAILVAYFIWPYIKCSQKIIACIVVIIVAISRISLAMHYPADIIYSLFITTFLIVISKIIYKKLENNMIKWFGNIISRMINS
jgi:membrane-associated phospholipid phosphatase